jgi:phosphatidylglycerophosphate synthase
MSELSNNLTVSNTRNSWLRLKSSHAIQGVVDHLHRRLPKLSPTHLNILGVIGVGLGSVIAIKKSEEHSSRNSIFAASLLGLSASLDAFDGTLARTIALEDPEIVNFHTGQIKDVISDRLQEVIMALVRSLRQGGSKFGRTMALLTAATSTFPSLARAYNESKGKAVPETGKGPLEFIGTRAGRTAIGIMATAFPKVKKIPIQPVADALITGANIYTAIKRLKKSRGTTEAILPQDIRDDGRNRLIALTVFAGISLAATLATHFLLQRKKRLIKKNMIERQISPETKNYFRILSLVEQYCQENLLDHRFVGGSLTDFIGPQTRFTIDAHNRTISFENPNSPTLFRSDGTVKDVDLVIFSKDRKAFKEARQTFKKWKREAQEQGIPFPIISAEAARYPDWPQRRKLLQFVTSFEVRSGDRLFLTYGEVEQEIPKETIDPWTVDLGDSTTITVLHPFAHALCYMLRVPRIKYKDKEINRTEDGSKYNKTNLVMRLAREAIRTGAEVGIDYKEMYTDWITYIKTLQNNPDWVTRIKTAITKWYWNSIGTDVSHGKGFLNVLASLSDRFSG